MEQHWKNRSGFILAAAGSAVGLGNLWKFPYVVGTHGGGAFVLLYILCVLLLGIPALTSEVSIGYKEQKTLWPALASYKGGKFLSCIAFTASTFIPAFYSVVGGWILGFLCSATQGDLTSSLEFAQSFQTSLSSSFSQTFLWQLLFLLLSFGIVILGVQNGIEKANKIMMPILIALLIGLLITCATMAGFTDALIFLFEPRFDHLTSTGVIEALGHSFFTLSVGCGVMLTYGSYLPQQTHIMTAILSVIVMDTLIALSAGCIIFTCVFTFGISPQSGPGLLFETLPVLFTSMPQGHLLAISFFLLVAMTAFTSMISLLEVLITSFMCIRNISRFTATILSLVWLTPFALAANLSWNHWSELKIFNLTAFGLMDFMASNVLLPAGGIAFLIIYGWVIRPPGLIGILSRYISPITLLIVWGCSIFLS